jgi:hypothetical protein
VRITQFVRTVTAITDSVFDHPFWNQFRDRSGVTAVEFARTTSIGAWFVRAIWAVAIAIVDAGKWDCQGFVEASEELFAKTDTAAVLTGIGGTHAGDMVDCKGNGDGENDDHLRGRNDRAVLRTVKKFGSLDLIKVR